MGGETFINHAKGTSASNAFNSVCDKARFDHGNSGYSGTIAEKSDFVMIDVPKGITDPKHYAEKLIDEGDKRIDDKWGPAGCFDLGNGEFLFFGWASS